MRFLVDLQRIWDELTTRFAAKISALSLAETPHPENPFFAPFPP